MFSWTFSNDKNRSTTWYIVVSIIMLTLVIYGIIAQLYLMAIVVVLFAGIYIYIENNSAPETRVIVDEKKILIDTSEYFFENFASFAIMQAEGRAFFLRLHSKKTLSPPLDVPFWEYTDVNELRLILLQILPENEKNEMSQMDLMLYASKI